MRGRLCIERKRYISIESLNLFVKSKRIIAIICIVLLIIISLCFIWKAKITILEGLGLVSLGVIVLEFFLRFITGVDDKNKKHTNDLKKVIEQWIKRIPNASTDKLQTLNFGILTCYKEGINPFLDNFVQGTFNDHEMRLTIEDEYIFKDLLFHLEKQDPEIVILWNKYKEKCVEQYNMGNELVSEMAKEFTEQIEREIGIRQLKFKITKYGTETNSISENFLNVIFQACIIYSVGEKEEFPKFYENFESRTGHKDNTIGYSISDLSTGYITIEKGLLEEGKFKIKMDNVMIQMFEKAKTDYYPKGKKLVNLIVEISSSEKRIKKLLGQQLIYEEFKGNCNY